MNRISFFHGAIRSCALAALPFLFAASASAQGPYPQSPQVVFRGLDCSRCAPGATYCVVNPLRFEYTCAPQGTYACAGISRTAYCRYGAMCWDGYCR